MKAGTIKSITITYDDGEEEIITAENRLSIIEYKLNRNILRFIDGHTSLGNLLATVSFTYIVKE